MRRLGWESADIVLFSGDAYIDHPAFGIAVIARVLESYGFKVAVVPQPNWRDDLRDFKKMGRPNLFFALSSGAMDSMVNHYTAFKRLRSDDAYTAGGRAGQRPDRAVNVYTKILKQLYPDVPVVIGGIEASLRRLTHYDYWEDRLMPSILIDSGADYLAYGMAEKAMAELAMWLKNRKQEEKPTRLKQIAYYTESVEDIENKQDTILMHSFKECCEDKKAFIENFNIIEREANSATPKRLIEPYKDGYVVVNEPYKPLSTKELDKIYDLPYTYLPHPRYKGKAIPAYDMIKNSITIHRGCFGGCSFCTIAAHQGKFIQSRSAKSIIDEINKLSGLEGFSGNLSDIGAPSANMYRMEGKDKTLCSKCLRKSCLFPAVCRNLDRSLKPLLELYKKIDELPNVKHSYIGSGVRYDLIFDRNGYIDSAAKEYFKELILRHISGRFKVAPEHTEEHILKIMGKPSFELFKIMQKEFERLKMLNNSKLQLVPYFISSHPGCKLQDMKNLSQNRALKRVCLDQVQSFTPTPMTRSSVMYYTGKDTKTLEPLFCEKNIERQREQKGYFFQKK